jgi:hypothetical protein
MLADVQVATPQPKQAVSCKERAQRTRFGPAGVASSSPVGAGPARPVRF